MKPVVLRVSREAMGTQFQIIVCGDNERELERAANDALDEVQRLDRQMSAYRRDSELSFVNTHAAERPITVDPNLFRLLESAARIWEATEGAFDVTVGPLVDCWRTFRTLGRLPSQTDIERARALVGMSHVQLDARRKTVSFDRPGVKIDLGGIAKGLAVDHAVEALCTWGVKSALVHAGWSTVYALNRAPDATEWRVGIRHPCHLEQRIDVVSISDEALSTSGNYERSFHIGGVAYSHIIDPRTGWPARGILSASALSAAAVDSDALSTAFFIMGVEKTKKYCDTRPNVGAVLVPAVDDEADLKAVRIGRAQ